MDESKVGAAPVRDSEVALEDLAFVKGKRCLALVLHFVVDECFNDDVCSSSMLRITAMIRFMNNMSSKCEFI